MAIGQRENKEKREFTHQKKRRTRFGGVGRGARTAPLRAGAGPASPSNARSLSRDVVGEASCGGPEYSAPQQLFCWFHLKWTLGGTVVWGCSACLEPRWPWRPREGCYMLARCRVGSTLDLNRSGPAASRHLFCAEGLKWPLVHVTGWGGCNPDSACLSFFESIHVRYMENVPFHDRVFRAEMGNH